MSISGDPDWSESVRSLASSMEYSLELIRTGSMALNVILKHRPDLGLLDLNLPDVPGLSWLNMLRSTEAGSALPVIVFHDKKPDESVAEAFACGADDYILKSCHPLELAARIRATLRRRFERAEQLGGELRGGDVSLDPSRHICRVSGEEISLRPREFELLEILMRKAGRVLSRAYLLEAIWGMSRQAETRTVDVTVGRLRKALGARAGRCIDTVERFGYRFRLPGTQH